MATAKKNLLLLRFNYISFFCITCQRMVYRWGQDFKGFGLVDKNRGALGSDLTSDRHWPMIVFMDVLPVYLFNSEEEDLMKLSAPKKTLFLISIFVAVLAIVAVFVSIPFVTPHAFWVLTAGYVMLAAGVFFKGI
ncbi:MAG: hypothetical protein OEY50_02785 [Nitrospinota bacterium]|nr:hypothetical protein [Nitrospinota bacterium]